MSAATFVYCAVCFRAKAPIGRSVAVEMAGGLCDDSCSGYRGAPAPDCRWPGEEFCGPGCGRGDSQESRQ